jgi:Tn7-like transposition protein D
MWRDSSLSVRNIAQRLGTDHKSVKYKATRLGLPFPRKGPSPKIMRADPELRKMLRRQRRRASSMPKRVERYRRQWLEAMKKHPEATRSQLMKEILPRVYLRLLYYDRDWLKRHMPPRRRVRPDNTLDWAAIDAHSADEVRCSAFKLKSVRGRPIRVTKMAIARDVDKVSLLCNKVYLDKLPLTQIAIADVVERRVDYRIRCIKWAADCFRQENVTPHRSEIARRAGGAPDLNRLPLVKAAIEDAYMQLQTREYSIDRVAAGALAAEEMRRPSDVAA